VKHAAKFYLSKIRIIQAKLKKQIACINMLKDRFCCNGAQEYQLKSIKADVFLQGSSLYIFPLLYMYIYEPLALR
jgi:hypothetical protein